MDWPKNMRIKHMNSYQTQTIDYNYINNILKDVPLTYYPDIANAVNSIEAGVYLSQLLYWTDYKRNPTGWIYKTQEEWTKETGMSAKDLNKARNRLKKLNILEEQKDKETKLIYFRINFDNLYQTIKSYYENRQAKKDKSTKHE